MKTHFISINSISSIPLIRHLVNNYVNSSAVYIVEVYIKKANKYFEDRNDVNLLPILEYRTVEDFINNIGQKKFRRYHQIVKYLLKIAKNKEEQLIYTNDFQVVILIKLVYRFFKVKPKLVYHQFEIIEKKKLGKASRFLYQYFLKSKAIVNLFVFPEKNRLNYFTQGLDIPDRKVFLFPNTCAKNSKNDASLSIDIPQENKICLHVGAVGGTNHYYQNFLEAIKRHNNLNTKITFVFIGRLLNWQKEEIEGLGLRNTIIIPSVPHEKLSAFYSIADFGVILYKGTSLNYEYCAPNKLYEFWSYGIPVLGHKLLGLKTVFKYDFQGKLIDFDAVDELVENLGKYSISAVQKKQLSAYFNEELDIQNYLEELNVRVDF